MFKTLLNTCSEIRFCTEQVGEAPTPIFYNCTPLKMLLSASKTYAQKPKLSGSSTTLLLIWEEWLDCFLSFLRGTVSTLLGRVDSLFALSLSRGAQIFNFTLDILPFVFGLVQGLLSFLGSVLGGAFCLLLPTDTKFNFKKLIKDLQFKACTHHQQ